MTRNQKGGAKFKKFKRGEGVVHEEKLVECDDSQGQHYALVQTKLGDGRFKVDIVTQRGTEQTDCLAILAGSMRKNKWKNFVAEKSLVLVTTLQDGNKNKEKYWIIKRYDDGDVKNLVRMKRINLSDYNDQDDDDAIGFCEKDRDDGEGETKAASNGKVLLGEEEEEGENVWETFDAI